MVASRAWIDTHAGKPTVSPARAAINAAVADCLDIKHLSVGHYEGEITTPAMIMVDSAAHPDVRTLLRAVGPPNDDAGQERIIPTAARWDVLQDGR